MVLIFIIIVIILVIFIILWLLFLPLLLPVLFLHFQCFKLLLLQFLSFCFISLYIMDFFLNFKHMAWLNIV